MTPAKQTYAALHSKTGGRLFTVTVLDRSAGLARRVYTSHPRDYPVSGTKPMAQGTWTTQVIERGEVFVANSVAEFVPYFADHALIETLGCSSALNIPIGGEHVIGTVNILDVAGHFTPDRVVSLMATVNAEKSALMSALAQAKF